MSTELEVIDLAKAFGSRDFLIMDQRYQTDLAKHPLVRGLWTVGRYFVLVGNMAEMKIELVSGDCEMVSGYNKSDIERLGAQFVMQFSSPQETPFNLSVVKLAIEYTMSRGLEERELIYVVYFYRAQKKDGSFITIQQQSIPIVFDSNGVPFIFSNIYTDISYLGMLNTPQAILVNKNTDEIFHIDPQHLQLMQYEDLFTAREKEIIGLLIRGLNSRQIGDHLHISMETVRTHRKNILKKAGANSTTELVGFAMTHGVV